MQSDVDGYKALDVHSNGSFTFLNYQKNSLIWLSE
jgi:hypothetical protein